MNVEVAVCLPRESVTIAVIRGIAEQMVRLLGVERRCADEVLLALSEACTNVVEHADVDDEYECRLRFDDQECQLTVTDAGHGFDVDALTGAMPDPSSPRGRGVAIMRAVMDSVDLTSTPGAGSIVRLTKRLVVTPGGMLDRLRPSGSVLPE